MWQALIAYLAASILGALIIGRAVHWADLRIVYPPLVLVRDVEEPTDV